MKTAMDYAAAVNEEIRDLFAAGADVVQLDEPYMQARPEIARNSAVKRSIARLMVSTARPVHICFGYAHVVHARPRDTCSYPNSKIAPLTRFPSKPHNPGST